ncbi:hypothetical protein ACQP1K_12335 [Sphaerimonospora sp. CA-214678]|uniref:hypothetical protein n=1 Tax=Sphaerimonospora sp. CA-214678 TaxID=3240029 RepID=UPI003D8F10C4
MNDAALAELVRCALAVGVAGYKLFRVRRDQRALGLRYLSAFFLCLVVARVRERAAEAAIRAAG